MQARDPGTSLMERAGDAIARAASQMAAARAQPILFLVGPGNNGGDALVAARVLHERGIDVRVALLDDPARFKGDAAEAWKRWSTRVQATVDPHDAIDDASLVVDGLFGIGFARAPTGRAREWIELVQPDRWSGARDRRAERRRRRHGKRRGHRRSRGSHDHVPREQAGAVHRRCGGPRRRRGRRYARRRRCDDRRSRRRRRSGRLAQRPSLFAKLLEPRRLDSNKGTFGSVAVVGGDHGMVGAALMASRTALHVGAGRVYVRLIASDAPSYDVVQPELMLRDSLDGVDATAVAIGPGLGHGDEAMALLAHWLAEAPALCVDADAPERDRAKRRRPRRPAARAVRAGRADAASARGGTSARLRREGRAARPASRAAARLASNFASVVVLKGAGTVDHGARRRVGRSTRPATRRLVDRRHRRRAVRDSSQDCSRSACRRPRPRGPPCGCTARAADDSGRVGHRARGTRRDGTDPRDPPGAQPVRARMTIT